MCVLEINKKFCHQKSLKFIDNSSRKNSIIEIIPSFNEIIIE